MVAIERFGTRAEGFSKRGPHRNRDGSEESKAARRTIGVGTSDRGVDIPGGLLDLLGDRLPQIHDDRLLAGNGGLDRVEVQSLMRSLRPK